MIAMLNKTGPEAAEHAIAQLPLDDELFDQAAVADGVAPLDDAFFSAIAAANERRPTFEPAVREDWRHL